MIEWSIRCPVRPQFACIDLFCGCGGNSWGVLQQNRSRQLYPLLALDNEPSALATYHWNMPEVDLVLQDIRTIPASAILRRIGLQPGELGCIIASPPCQTYSRNNRLPKDRNDYRNTLYIHTLRIISAIRPWTVLIENVPEMEVCNAGGYHTDFLEQLDAIGYTVCFWNVDSASYGVPQHRTRLIYLAYRKDMGIKPHCPLPTHGDQPKLHPWITVEEAIGDLPMREAGDEEDWFVVWNEKSKARSAYAQSRRPKNSKVIFNHMARNLNSIQLQRLVSLQEGEAYNDLPIHLKPKKGYKASYGRLWKSKPAPTLTTYLAYPGCGRFSHYDQNRVITIREALRLQSFDDNFRVIGNLSEQSTQVGNAVPPILATAFKDVIVADLETYFGVTSNSIAIADQRDAEAQCRFVETIAASRPYTPTA